MASPVSCPWAVLPMNTGNFTLDPACAAVLNSADGSESVQGGAVKFDMAAPLESPPAPAGDGAFDVDPAAVIGVLQAIDTEATGYSPAARTLLQEMSLLAEESKSTAIASRLAMITDEVLHHGMADLVGRTGNALNAVAEVLGILASADTAMSDTARHAAAVAAQRSVDDDPYAPGVTDTIVRDQAEAVQ